MSYFVRYFICCLLQKNRQVLLSVSSFSIRSVSIINTYLHNVRISSWGLLILIQDIYTQGTSGGKEHLVLHLNKYIHTVLKYLYFTWIFKYYSVYYSFSGIIYYSDRRHFVWVLFIFTLSKSCCYTAVLCAYSFEWKSYLVCSTVTEWYCYVYLSKWSKYSFNHCWKPDKEKITISAETCVTASL